MTRARVLLADDHAMVLDAFAKLLSQDYDIVGTVNDGRAAVARASELKPDVVVLDISMPVLNGLDAARRILQERAFQKKVPAGSLAGAREELGGLAVKLPTLGAPSRRALALVWTLHAAGAIDEKLLVDLLAAGDETLRAQAVKLASEPRKVSDRVAAELTKLAAGESSPLVRVHLAAAIQRLPLDQKWDVAQPLLAQAVDPHDPNLPLMLWYAVEPLAAADPRRTIGLLPAAKIPLVRQFLTRRIVSVHEGDGQPNPSNAWIMDELLKTLATAGDDVRRDILLGLQQTYRGRREMPAPQNWTAIAARLALGYPLEDSIDFAKRYVRAALIAAQGWRLGSGAGPVNHFVRGQDAT